tara:strand:+ start:41 stop:328 length:288 start_codon:yes stop_codon:yes gene_type:complete
MSQFNIDDIIYIKTYNQNAKIINISDSQYQVKTHNGELITVKDTDIIKGQDNIIQYLIQTLNQIQQDYQDSRDAWWRLKDEMLFYKNKCIQHNIK